MLQLYIFTVFLTVISQEILSYALLGTHPIRLTPPYCETVTIDISHDHRSSEEAQKSSFAVAHANSC